MEFNGEITTGLGKASYFISQEVYTKEFIKNCGFKPYPGTLNILISEKNLPKINKIKNTSQNIIKPKDFGAVKYIKAILNNQINGAIVFPAKTTHEETYLEFIAKENLRNSLNLKDGDNVTLKIIQ